MSGTNNIVICKSCNHSFEPRGKAMTVALTCPSCDTYFRRGAWNNETTRFTKTYPSAIPIGAKGKFDGTTYEVMGFAVKKEKRYKYSWREYLLFNPYLGYAFLSEYDGHWNFVWPLEDNPRDQPVGNTFANGKEHYQLFQRYDSEVIFAKGEFFFDLVDLTDSTRTEEYISPPFLIGKEESEDSLLWFKGEYITRKELSEAFNIALENLPEKEGIGYTEPISSSFSDSSLILVGVLLCVAAVIIQFVLSGLNTETEVYRNTFSANSLNDQKVFITPAFELDGGSKNLDIELYSSLSNNWFYSELTLINEDNGTEYNFTKEMEYYSGYEDGESWSEGTQTGEALLSKIPGGKYHINIYPQFSTTNQEFTITVRRDIATYSNFLIVIILIAIFPAIYLVRKRYKEQSRWSDSDFSPYETED